MNRLLFGDNLKVLQESVTSESVDLVYLDPPFNSNASYNVLFEDKAGTASAAQTLAFKDTWEWGQEAIEAYDELMLSNATPQKLHDLMKALRSFLTSGIAGHGNGMMAYLTMMALRLVELHRVLKPTGSIYLHCDSTASHYLKLILDATFGVKNYRNEIVWRRTGAHNSAKTYGRIHDTIFFYSKTDTYHFTPVKRPYMRGHVTGRFKEVDGKLKSTTGGNILTGPGATKKGSSEVWRGFNPSIKGRHWAIPGFLAVQMPPEFENLTSTEKLEALYQAELVEIVEGNAWPTPVRYLDDNDGQAVQDIWAAQPYTEGTVHGTEEVVDADVIWYGTTHPDRLGYPTQKPQGLLERIVRTSSKVGDVVLDPFCGCGTTIAVAERLKRQWIGIDVTYLAVDLIERRLLDSHTPAGGTKLSALPVQTRRKALKQIWRGDSNVATDGLKINVKNLAPFEVSGDPTDLEGARRLFQEDPYQFEWWCVAMVGAAGKDYKRGADRGIDGTITFRDGSEYRKILISVKGGGITRHMVSALLGDVQNQAFAAGVLISLEEPTGPMKIEAAQAGKFSTVAYGDFPKVQLLTVRDLLTGGKVLYPLQAAETFKTAIKSGKKESGQIGLDL